MSRLSSRPQALDALRFPLHGSQLIEASAGTGKTYTIASLYVRLVLGHGIAPGQRPLTPPEILVVTFTRAATQELRDRIRRRLTEAAACFLQENEEDDFLCNLRADYEPERWPGCARLLQIAADWMDDASVSTIDAWCYRMLREYAFDSASLFDIQMDTDAAALVTEATQDYWRLFIAPLPAEDCQLVLDTCKSCKDLASALHKTWLALAHACPETPEPRVLAARWQAGIEASKAPWREWVPELRERLQEAYDGGHYHKSRMKVDVWRNALVKLEAWAEGPEAEVNLTPAALRCLTPEGLAAIWKEGDLPRHPAFQALAGLGQAIAGANSEIERLYSHAAPWVARRVADLRRQRATLDYSDLLSQLDAALQGPNGERLAQRLRSQFPAALIDEFQDTNPVQYRIFDKIYEVSTNRADILLALIGDPKQAIYSFRGADIHAYLAARQACAGRLHTLSHNFRSSAAMVGAVNHLFEVGEQKREKGAFLFGDTASGADNPVPFLPVEAARDPGQWWVDGQDPETALTVWLDTTQTQSGLCGKAVAQACASEILRLLQLGSEGRAGFRRGDTFAPLRARDIAILVNNRDEAADLRGELSQRGIRSVYLSDDGSVYQSIAAKELLDWLRACAEPENGAYVRAALATGALGLDWHQLDRFVHDELQWEATLERFASYKDHWRQRGVLPMLRRFMHDFGVPAKLFSAPDGERQLTDLLHLAELLQAAATHLDGEHALIRHLETCLEEAGKNKVDGDPSRVRLESDTGLVQIVTVHKSKGLEYPLVFYPYAYHSRLVTLRIPAEYRTVQGEQKVLTCRADASLDEQQQILESIGHERLAEDMRKLYVALTRARHATWLALAPLKVLGGAPLGYLLGGAEACAPETLEGSLSELTEGCPAIAVTPFPEVRDTRLREAAGEVPARSWRTLQRPILQTWNMSSYSSLTRLALERSGISAARPTEEAALALPDAAPFEIFQEAYLADAVDPSGPPAPDQQPEDSQAEAGIHAFPKGAAAGSLLHGLLEWVFRQGPHRALADPEALHEQVERRCRSRGWQAHAPAVTEWLRAFCTRSFRLTLPGHGRQGDLVLADLDTVVPEMEFWFGVRDTDLPHLDALVSRHFLPGRPRARISYGDLNGLLRGFIDLVFEHQGRYYVADYKSNWLGPLSSDYDPQALEQAILHHRYDLQAALYLYALHRLLQLRLGAEYDYEQHMGGALVFLIRGDRAASQGLHIERPALQVLEEMETLFKGGKGQKTCS